VNTALGIPPASFFLSLPGKMLTHKATFLLLALCFALGVKAQVKDTVRNSPRILNSPKDTVQIKKVVLHSARKATLFSALVPGLGQAYNEKYWKIPVIYAAGAATTYMVIYNNNNFQQYRHALKYRYDNDSTTNDIFPEYSDDNLLVQMDKYQRKRDLFALVTLGIYVMNIVDACVDGNLYYFDVSDDLGFNVQPVIMNTAFHTQTAGLGLSIKF
jgi:hypothetical protein